jgi:hypothetical protein
VLPETEYAQTVADYVSYAAPIGGLNILRIDLTTTFKKACTFSTMTGLEASLLRIGLPSSSFSTYTYTKADGSKVTGVRNPSGISVSVAALQPKGYVALYPDFYGSCGVYALTRGLLFRIAGDVLTVGYDKGGQTVQAGTVWKNSVLLVRDAFGSYDLGNFDKIRSYFGSGGAPGFAPTMVSGTVAGGSFCPLELDAQSNRVEFNTSTASFPNDLPVMVRGLSEKSTACLFDLDKAELKPIGVTEGVGYTRFGTSTPRRIWIGNILIADNPDVWVELVDLDWQNPRIRLHNPTDSDIVTSVTGMLPVMSQTWNSVLVPSGTTIEVGGDNTPPTAPLIRDDGVSTTNHRMLHAFWVSIDPESGILGYRCAVGLTPTDTGEYVVPWTPLSPDTEANVSGEFQTGKTYYFYIKAYNGANMISSAVSDGILVKSSIISAKFEPDTTMVTLDNVVITAAFPSYQRYYAEEYDRAGAIALLGSATCSQGDEINASGQIRTAGGERILWLSILNVVSSDNPLPGPFALTNRELGGASSTLHQGVDGGVGPSNQAFLVRTWGRVVDAGLGYFKIDDGSCVPSYVGVDGLMVVHSYPNPNVGEFVCVTGISSVTKVNNVNYRALRTRSLTDLQVMY